MPGKDEESTSIGATEQFARYTDRIKELEENDNIINGLLCHQHHLIFILTQAQLAASTQEIKSHRRLGIEQLPRV
jgi:hypothetical protein